MGNGGEGEGDGGGANAFNLLMTLLSTEKLVATGAPAAVDPEQAESVRAIKAAIREQMAVDPASASRPTAVAKSEARPKSKPASGASNAKAPKA